MAEFAVNTQRYDPYRGFLFQVTLEGAVVAGVSKVGALSRSTEVVSHRPGNAVAHQYHSPGLTSHEPIVLERGVTFDMTFHDWANRVYSPEGLGGVSLKNFRQDILVTLMNLQGVPAISYQLRRAWVSEFQALPEFDANNMNTVGIQTITLQHEGFVRDEAVTEPSET